MLLIIFETTIVLKVNKNCEDVHIIVAFKTEQTMGTRKGQ